MTDVPPLAVRPNASSESEDVTAREGVPSSEEESKESLLPVNMRVLKLI